MPLKLSSGIELSEKDLTEIKARIQTFDVKYFTRLLCLTACYGLVPNALLEPLRDAVQDARFVTPEQTGKA
jgi:hypothetical protein